VKRKDLQSILELTYLSLCVNVIHHEKNTRKNKYMVIILSNRNCLVCNWIYNRRNINMNKYTLAQILEAWDAAYGEDMHEEYPGFIQRLSEETDKETDIKNLREQIKNDS